MTFVLLDTHILIWWQLGSGKLSKEQTRILMELERQGRPFGISAMTLWEIGVMAACRGIAVARPIQLWLAEVEVD